MGPTATGKTDLAVELATSGPFEIISVDSAMVYRGMDIGTAKPDAATRDRAPHRLLDFLDPAEPYSAARFAEDARGEIAAIHRTGRIPLLVGGTMLYFRALLEGLSPLPDADPAVRQRLEEEAARDGWPALHARLARIDPAAAARIEPADAQRIERALEVWEQTGRPISELQQTPREPLPWRVRRIGLLPRQRHWLHARIERRFHAMMESGFLEEVQRLYARGDLHPGLPAVRAVGYRQLWAHLAGECSLEEAVRRGIVASRQYAKRQITWLRRETELDTIAVDQEPALARVRSRVSGLLSRGL